MEGNRSEGFGHIKVVTDVSVARLYSAPALCWAMLWPRSGHVLPRSSRVPGFSAQQLYTLTPAGCRNYTNFGVFELYSVPLSALTVQF